MRLNVQVWKGGKTAPRTVGSSLMRIAVYAHVLREETTLHAVLLGRDSWSQFSVRKYRDVTETERL